MLLGMTDFRPGLSIAFRWNNRPAQMSLGRSTGSFWDMTGTVLQPVGMAPWMPRIVVFYEF